MFFSSIPRSSAVISRPPGALGIAPGGLHAPGWFEVETCAAKRHLPKALVKVLELAVDLCRRSRMVPMRKTPRASAAFSLGRLSRPIIDPGQYPQSGWWISALYIIIIGCISVVP
jgi:hypothetical protein